MVTTVYYNKYVITTVIKYHVTYQMEQTTLNCVVKQARSIQPFWAYTNHGLILGTILDCRQVANAIQAACPGPAGPDDLNHHDLHAIAQIVHAQSHHLHFLHGLDAALQQTGTIS
jgi:hypothetical protein